MLEVVVEHPGRVLNAADDVIESAAKGVFRDSKRRLGSLIDELRGLLNGRIASCNERTLC
jgi:hypothetical protein